jgi:hypothetical protein
MRLKLIYKYCFYSFVASLLYLITACTNRMEESSDGSSYGEGQAVSVNIMPKLAIGDETKVTQLRVIIFSTRSSNPYGTKVLVSNGLIDINEDYSHNLYRI